MFFTKIAVSATALFAVAQAGWITFQNENKQTEGLPCVGAIYGDDNFLVSRFDCGATDWNSSFCGIHCFPFSATTCVGKVPADVNNGTGNGLWYAPHSVQSACQFLGTIDSPSKPYDMAGVNVTSCGYVDWPSNRTWGPTVSVPPFPVTTNGCWNVSDDPKPKFPKRTGHFFDGAQPLNTTWCDDGFAAECGDNKDPICTYSFDNDIRINCQKTNMPKTVKPKED
ncbi:hypothetical protein MVES1_000099 [Malassezia vespertilionis]|uniref:Secreted protein n=1 Tax=Malassezia vespertilionis TaxID=2020962 RepID=A0A2N1JHJ9_9BASI|nr:uncharacterized protein MVES1_000099 [Malassezia vespertilionis]PKI86019.1 hypothetical protein MVES_000099 [Malassezia vespertilionis]WFD04775.1 hypothetical protein MVES1_000099 [Malassezia vespertilionis]